MNNKNLKIVVILIILFSGLLFIEMNLSASGWWCACIHESEAWGRCNLVCSTFDGGCDDVRVHLGSCMCFQNVCFCYWDLICNNGNKAGFNTADFSCPTCNFFNNF